MIVSSFVKLSIAGERVCFTTKDCIALVSSSACRSRVASRDSPKWRACWQMWGKPVGYLQPGHDPQKVARALAGDWTRNDRVEILEPRLSKVRVIYPRLFQLSPWTSKVKYGGTTCLGNYEPPARKGQFVVRMTKPCLVFADSNLCISQLNSGPPTPGAWLGIAGI